MHPRVGQRQTKQTGEQLRLTCFPGLQRRRRRQSEMEGTPLVCMGDEICADGSAREDSLCDSPLRGHARGKGLIEGREGRLSTDTLPAAWRPLRRRLHRTPAYMATTLHTHLLACRVSDSPPMAAGNNPAREGTAMPWPVAWAGEGCQGRIMLRSTQSSRSISGVSTGRPKGWWSC